MDPSRFVHTPGTGGTEVNGIPAKQHGHGRYVLCPSIYSQDHRRGDCDDTFFHGDVVRAQQHSGCCEEGSNTGPRNGDATDGSKRCTTDQKMWGRPFITL